MALCIRRTRTADADTDADFVYLADSVWKMVIFTV